MIISINFNSDEAIYMQVRNQIILGIAADKIKEGDELPSVRQLADDIGINMHTVSKAYTALRQEGFLKLDRRKGAVVSFDINKIKALEDMREEMLVILAKAICRDISEEEVHQLVHGIFTEFME